jgi:predicted DNA-binding transcriptional regulator YafY
MRADRLISIVMLLQARGKLTTSALAAELGVSKRTVLRDIDALSVAGVPVYAEGGHGGGVALDEGYRTSLTGLKDAEVRALFVGTSDALLREVGLGDAVASTRRKLSAALPAQQQDAVRFITQRLYIDPQRWWHDATPSPYWAAMQEAVHTDRVIEADYENFDGELARRQLEPYSLVSKSGAWYLVAKHDGAMRTYRVERFHSVCMLTQGFDRDPAFDLPGYWQTHLGEFRTSFTGYTCVLAVHPDQMGFVRFITPGRHEVLDTEADGWTQARLQMESEDMARMIVFGMGTQARVIAPDALREAVAARCRDLLAHLSTRDKTP